MNKKPDFSKLKEGDYVYIEYGEDEKIIKIIAKFENIREGWIRLEDSLTNSIKITAIKKVFRVNIKEKIIEEV